MQVLITGGLGAIGSWIVRAAVAAGLTPVVMDTSVDRRFIGDLPAVEVVAGSIISLTEVCDVIRHYRIERIVHAAALMPPACAQFPERAVAVNVQGALNVFQAARLAGIDRVVTFSSKGVYGEILPPHGYPDYVPVTEDLRLAPQSIYDATKVMVEQLAAEIVRQGGPSILCLRLATTFGPGKSRHGILSLHSQIIDTVLMGQPFAIDHGGDEACDVIFNGEVGRAAVLAVEASRVPRFGLYHVSSGQATRLRDFATWVQEVVGGSIQIGPGLNYMDQAHPTYCCLDPQRAAKDLGFVAQGYGAEWIRQYCEVARRWEPGDEIASAASNHSEETP